MPVTEWMVRCQRGYVGIEVREAAINADVAAMSVLGKLGNAPWHITGVRPVDHVVWGDRDEAG